MRRLRQQPEILREYDSVIKDQREGRFSLQKWISNPCELMKLIRESEEVIEEPVRSVSEEDESYPN